MLSALIVDDESAVRRGLERFIHWKDIGIGQVYAAASAAEGMEIINAHHPDIILSDIRMPGMSGIELCELVRARNFDCRIIFISGYSDREYYKKAIRIAVEDYIEKPVDIAVVEECLQHTVEKRLQDRERCRREEDLRSFAMRSPDSLRSMVLDEFLHGKWNQTVVDQLPEISASRNKQFLCLIFRQPAAPEQQDTNFSGVIAAMNEIMGNTVRLYMVKNDIYLIYLIAFTRDEYMHSVFNQIENIKRRVSTKGSTLGQLFLAISGCGSGASSIPALYEQATILLQRLFYMGWNHWVSETGKSEPKECGTIRLEPFARYMASSDYEGARNFATEQYNYLMQQMDTLPVTIKNIYYELNFIVFQHISMDEQVISTDDAVEKGILWERINGFETIKECHQYLMSSIDHIEENKDRYLSDNRLITDIMRYIQHHFKEPDLSIGKIADAMYLSGSYLSFFFKRQTGKNVIQVIRDYRLDYSVTLLKKRGLSLAEIAQQCGYTSQNYWAKVFHSKFGMSPSEYRERMF